MVPKEVFASFDRRRIPDHINKDLERWQRKREQAVNRLERLLIHTGRYEDGYEVIYIKCSERVFNRHVGNIRKYSRRTNRLLRHALGKYYAS